MGAELCLAHDMGGGGIWGAPFGRHAALWLFHLYGNICFCKYLCTLELWCSSAAVVICTVIANFGVAIVKSLLWCGLVFSLPMCFSYYLISSITMPSVFFISVVLRELYPILGLGLICHLLH